MLFIGLLATLIFSLVGAQANPRPVIGILSLPNTAYAKQHGYSDFPASYVKFLESGGARVVPIPYDLSSSALDQLLGSINGALFTGGSAAFWSSKGVLTQYGLTGQRIFNESVNSFAKGEIWPLWGTCLGFELINVLAAEDDGAVLTPGWDSENYTTVVSWVDEAATSRLWSSPSVRAAFATENIALNAHTSGVSPADFASATALSSRFSILGTSVDRNQKEFVASIEGKDNLPIYATQWHPEKALFEWPEDWVEYIPHNYSAVSNNYAPAAFFVEQARKNLRAFPSPAALDEVIIYNYNPIHGISTNFEQIYFFPQSN